MKQVLLFFFTLALSLPLCAQYYAVDDTTTIYPSKGTVYANMFVGRKTSSGEVFVQDKYTAAHWKIKLGTLVLVTNVDNGKQVIVKVNDRCPKRGVIDLTRRAATAIGIKGMRKVTIQILPDRFFEQWEQQGDLDGFSDEPRDTVLAPTAKPYQTAKAPELKDKYKAPDKAKQNNATAKSTTSDTASKISDKAPTLYDLDLCTVKTQKQAEFEVSRLPILYREQVSIISCSDGQILVRLKLSQPYSKVQETQKSLLKTFPKSMPHKIKRK